MRVVITVKGHKEVGRMYGRVMKRMNNPNPAWDVIINMIHAIQSKQFTTQGARGGIPWDDITDDWREKKARMGYDARILHMTLKLRESVTSRTAEGHYYRRTRTSLTVGTTIPYSKIVDEKRPIFGITPADEREFAHILSVYIAKGYLPRRGLV
jgi:hypothetical protein